jgi:ribonuclease D
MTMFEWFVYCELMEFFDEVARRYNKPVYQLVSKKIVQGLAQNPNRVHQWEETRGVFNQIKTADFRAQLQSTLDISINEAESRELSKSRKATETMSKSEYHAMRKEQHRINNLKNKLLSPIQDRLIHDYGKHAKAFILPNRLTKEIITGDTELMPDYKVKLFRKYADELDLDLSEFL